MGRGVRAGRSTSLMRYKPRAARRCSRRSCPVVGANRRTWRSVHSHLRRTLAYRAENAWSSTRSRQITIVHGGKILWFALRKESGRT